MLILEQYKNDVECLSQHINGRNEPLSDKINQMSTKMETMNNLKSKIENMKNTKQNNVGNAIRTFDTYKHTRQNPPRRLSPLVQTPHHRLSPLEQTIDQKAIQNMKATETKGKQNSINRPRARHGNGPDIPKSFPKP